MLSLVSSMAHSTEPKRPWNEYAVWESWVELMTSNFKSYQDVLVKQAAVTPTFFINYE